jgi:hypothetical protein
MVCKRDQKIPFDLQHHGVIWYDEPWVESAFLEQLHRQLSSLNDDVPDSPVSTFLNAELHYAATRAQADLQAVMREVSALTATGGDDNAIGQCTANFDRLWAHRDVQVALTSSQRIIQHREPSASKWPIDRTWMDAANGERSLHADCLRLGRGTLVAALAPFKGRLTVIAFGRIPGKDLLVIVEAHLSQRTQ